MKIYIDEAYKCHTAFAENLTEIETDFFDNKCQTYIEGFLFVPANQTWTREDGVVFTGEMITPWVDFSVLDAAQREYEWQLLEDMQNALETLGVNPNG